MDHQTGISNAVTALLADYKLLNAVLQDAGLTQTPKPMREVFPQALQTVLTRVASDGIGGEAYEIMRGKAVFKPLIAAEPAAAAQIAHQMVSKRPEADQTPRQVLMAHYKMAREQTSRPTGQPVRSKNPSLGSFQVPGLRGHS